MKRLIALCVLGLISGAAVSADACTAMYADVGKPRYVGDGPDSVELCRSGYALSHNNEHRTPDWVLERLTPARFKGPGDRNAQGNPFARDPDLQEASAQLADYKASSKGRKFDRGHMAPAADMKFTEAATEESFYLSNMSPQVGIGLNRHIWADLEGLVRNWTCERGDLVAVTGPIYGESPDELGPGKVAIPDAFYKVVYDTHLKRAIAFILPNEKVDKQGRTSWEALQDYIVPLGDVEKQTSLKFFPKLSKRNLTRIHTSPAVMWADRDVCEP